ncbi:type II CAAX prenyl endopeptidase Rce1 family protein [Candidatus Neomarinimicrobiota bacterium]
MKRLTLSLKIYICLVIVLALLMAISIFLPAYQDFMPTQELPASKPVLALVNAAMALLLYGGLGYLGCFLSRKLGFADIWDSDVTHRQRLLYPALIGVGLGVFFIVADTLLSRFHTLGALLHPVFPLSLLASATASIGEEILFRLFFVSLWTWLIARILLRGKGQEVVFWIIAVLSALAFAFGHLPAVMILYEFTSISDIPAALLAEIILLNGVLSVFAAGYLRKYGFLAAVGIHFWTDVVWHVIWGAI